MLAKYVVFFALAAFINAAPVVDYRPVEVRSSGPDEKSLPQLPAVNNKPLPGTDRPLPKPPTGTKREPLYDLDDIHHLFDLLNGASADADGGVGIALPPSRRWTTPADTRSYQISDVTFDEIPQGQGEVSSDNGDNLPGSKRSFGINGANYGDNGWPIPTKVIHNVIPRPTNNRPRP